MITIFKLFENYDISKKLCDQLDDDVIEEYFNEHCLMDAQEIINLWPNSIWQFVDDDEYIEDLIKSEISSYSIGDFDKDDYINYLKNNITDNKEEKILKIYNKKEKKDEDYYDYDMLESLTEKQLKKIIQNDDEEENFVEYIIKERYDRQDAQEVVENIYGKDWIVDNGERIYNMFSDYVDDQKIVDVWKDNTDKRDKVTEEISSSVDLQNILLNKKKSNVFLLAKLFIEEPSNDNISEEYDFQKAYIKRYVKKNIGNKSGEYLRAESIKYLYDNFELNYDIEEEFSDDMWMIDKDKFNI